MARCKQQRELLFQGRQIGYFLLYCGQVLLRHHIDGAAVLLPMVGKVEQVANLVDGKADVTRAAHKCEPGQVVRTIRR